MDDFLKEAQNVEENQLRFHQAFNDSGIGTAIIDDTGYFLEVNNAFYEMLDYDEDKINLLTIYNIVEDEYISLLNQKIVELKNTDIKHFEIELRIKHNQNRKLWVILTISLMRGGSNKINFIIQFIDRTEQHIIKEKLLYLKKFDALTNLLNRSSIVIAINNQIKQDPNQKFSLYFIGIDKFTLVNEIYGTSFSDNLLHNFSERFKNELTNADLIGYYGGCEFIFSIKNVDQDFCKEFVKEIKNTLLTPFLFKNDQITLTASIGISQYPKDGKDAQQLIKLSNVAMRKSEQKRGGHDFCFFKKSMLENVKKLTILNDLRLAIKKNEFEVHYQPKANKLKQFCGFEALVRWRKNGILIPPEQFISIAEETGVILEIGRYVLKEAITVYSKLLKNSLICQDSKVAINISPKQFSDDKFIDMMLSILKKYMLTTNNIELEITENALISNLQESKKFIDKLKKLGVYLSIDDFGTGYSSLTYLKEIAPNCLKIDKSFVSSCLSNKHSRLIIPSIISLAHKLNIDVIAEGVETKAQFDFLQYNSCEQFQGYYFSKPLPETELFKYLS